MKRGPGLPPGVDVGGVPGYRLAVQAHYDHLYARATPAEVAMQRAALAPYLARVLAALGAPAEGAHLDLGCGAGHLALQLARLRPKLRVVATDASEGAVASVRASAAEERVPNVEARAADAEAPPEGPFGSATALSLVALLPDKRAALAAWRRVVRGRLVVTDGCALRGPDPAGTGALTRDGFARLAEETGWTLALEEDLTDLVRALHARGAWPWGEYVREGYGYRLYALV